MLVQEGRTLNKRENPELKTTLMSALSDTEENASREAAKHPGRMDFVIEYSNKM